jgi:hypothetical protein
VLIFCTALTRPGKKVKCYKNKKTILKGYWMGKMTDHYFKLKKGNNFTLYTRILGLNKIEEWSGTYFQRGDSLILNFCGDSIPENLNGKGYIDNSKNLITLFSDKIEYEQRFGIRVDRR